MFFSLCATLKFCIDIHRPSVFFATSLCLALRNSQFHELLVPRCCGTLPPIRSPRCCGALLVSCCGALLSRLLQRFLKFARRLASSCRIRSKLHIAWALCQHVQKLWVIGIWTMCVLIWRTTLAPGVHGMSGHTGTQSNTSCTTEGSIGGAHAWPSQHCCCPMFPTLSNDGLLVANFGYTFQPWHCVVDLFVTQCGFLRPTAVYSWSPMSVSLQLQSSSCL